MRQADRALTPSWVAGSVRARHMLARRLGSEQAWAAAHAPSFADALAVLVASAYGRYVRPDMDIAAAQRAIAETTLWHLRVIAGWIPPRALQPMQALAAWFELANVDDRLTYLGGGEPPDPLVLGGLGTAWSRLGSAQSVAELRSALAGSPWGDPGTDDPAAIRLWLRLSWARRVMASVEEAGEWAAGALALLIARERFLADRDPAELVGRRIGGLGAAWSQAATVGALRAALPPHAAWALEGVEEPGDLWRAELAWWRTVAGAAERLSRSPLLGRPAVIGATVLLAADARRAAAALEVAARGASAAATEVFGAIA